MVVDFPVKAVADRLGYQSALWARGFVDLLNIKEKFLSVNGYLALFPGNLFFKTQFITPIKRVYIFGTKSI